MRGIVLAGGTGSRLGELTRVTNKHLLPVHKRPMICYPVEKLVRAGIQDILIVTGTEHMGDMVSFLGSGKEFGCDFTYRVQDRAGGIAEALGLAKSFARYDRMVVVLGDNLFEDEFDTYVNQYLQQKRGARILLKQVHDPERFGVAEISKEGTILSIEEKPKKPKSHFAVTGAYFYDEQVFDIITELKPSGRGELEISDVNQAYMIKGDLEYSVLFGYWSDMGTFESLAAATKLVEQTERDESQWKAVVGGGE